MHAGDSRPREPILAGVDLGTLTCRLLIARVSEGRLTEVYSDRRILRLGEGVHEERLLRESAMVRVIETLKEWRGMIQRHGADGETAVATSAVRDARNRDEFLQHVRRETGFEVEVLQGHEEARRTMLGIRAGLPAGVLDVLGLDIGGGSTEFIKFHVERDGLPSILSVDVGVVRLTEAILHHDPPTPEERARATALIETHVRTVSERLGDLRHTTLVGTAGAITALAAMVQQLPRYDVHRIHNFRLGLPHVTELEEKLVRLSQADRKMLYGLEPGREDVILAGTLILRGVMRGLGFEECLVSDLGLREGIVLDLAARLAARREA